MWTPFLRLARLTDRDVGKPGQPGPLARDRAGEMRVRQFGNLEPGLRSVLMASLALGALVCATPAGAGSYRQLNLPAGPLDGALSALAAQTGDQLIYAPDMVAGRRAPALTGRYNAEGALARLLVASDLVATRAGPKLIVLKLRVGSSAVATKRVEVKSAEPSPFGAEAKLRAEEGGPAAPPLAIEPPHAVEEVRVTGTHIRGGVPAAPVLVLDRESLDRSGHTTLAGALQALPQNYGGQDTEGTVATGADTQGSNSTYATGINLRGLGPSATLVLVNGRRLGGSGISGDFADLSTLPTVAVSRVEILLDGASAVYGSDAVAGVVNEILRQDLEGGEVRVSAGAGASGTPREYQVGAVVGHLWASGGVLLAYEYYQRDALAAADRAYTASADLRPFGGTDRRVTTAFPGNVVAVNPATGVSGPFYGIPAGQNGVGLRPADFQAGVINRTSRQDGLDVLPGQRRQSLYAAAHQDVGERLEVSGDARYGFRAARATIAGPTSTFTIGRNNPFFVSPNGAASNQIQYSFVGELPNPIIRATAENLSASLGGRLRLAGDWAADGYLGFSQEIDEARSKGNVNTAILAEALGNSADRRETAYTPARDGFFNPYTGLAANPVAVTSAIGSGFTINRSRSQVRTANLQADGSLFSLPGGPVKVALGVNARRETFRRVGSSYTSTVAPAAQNGVDGSRGVVAGFAEVRVPLVGDGNARPGIALLELSGAVRAERYSDFGHTIDPKVGLIWAPVPDLRLRATYGQSFHAPGLNQLLGLESISPINLTLAGAQVLTLSRQGGNLDLQPETANSWTAGFDYRPPWSPGSHLSLTWFDTDYKNRIGRPVNENIAGALEDPRFAAFVQRVSPATNAADLALVRDLLSRPNATAAAGLNPPASYVAIVDLRNVNTGELHVRGLDLQLTQSMPAFGGSLALSADATRLLTYDQRLTPTAAAGDLLGRVTYPAKLRGRLAADWTRGHLGGGVAVNYLIRFHDALGTRISDQTTVDLQLRAKAPAGRFDGATVSLSVRNLFDKAPPFYDNPTGYAYDPGNADVIGRFVRIQLTKSW